jgi:hypothetical protein
MPDRQDPPLALRAACRRAGILPFIGAWYRQDRLADPRQYAGVRCHCVAEGKLVLLRQIDAESGSFRVGQCPACHTVVWSTCVGHLAQG